MVCQDLFPAVSKVFPSGFRPVINISCTTGEPSTANIAFVPPLALLPEPWSKLSLIISGNFPAINGGTKAQRSSPDFASNACNIPSLAPT